MPFVITDDELFDLLYSYYNKLSSIPEKNLNMIHFMVFLEYILSFYIQGDAS